MTRTTRVLAPILLLAGVGSASGGDFTSTWKAEDLLLIGGAAE